MDELVTQADQWHRSQLSRQLKRLVRAIAVLSYCGRDNAIDAVAESITEVDQTLIALSASPSTVNDYLQQLETSIQSESQRLIIEAHALLTQARLLINEYSSLRFNDLNVVEMRQNQADLADAAFERMLAASNVPCLYSAASSYNFLISSTAEVDQNKSTNDAAESASLKRAKTKNKRLATHLKLVVDNSDSILPVNPGEQ
jgi:hypothetical protein